MHLAPNPHPDPPLAVVPVSAVADSAAEPVLAEDPVWLERTARGIFCLMWVAPLDAAARILLMIVATQLMDGSPEDLFANRAPLGIAAAAFAGCAAWLLTRPVHGEPDATPARLWPLALATFLGWAIGEAIGVVAVNRSLGGVAVANPPAIARILAVRQAAEIAAVVALCLLLVRVLRLTRRTFGPEQAGRLHLPLLTYGVLLAVATGLSTLATLALVLRFEAGATSALLSGPATVRLAAVATAPLAVYAGLLAYLFFRLGHLFRRRGQAATRLGRTLTYAFDAVVIRPPES